VQRFPLKKCTLWFDPRRKVLLRDKYRVLSISAVKVKTRSHPELIPDITGLFFTSGHAIDGLPIG
jgi:hypothetical protein